MAVLMIFSKMTIYKINSQQNRTCSCTFSCPIGHRLVWPIRRPHKTQSIGRNSFYANTETITK